VIYQICSNWQEPGNTQVAPRFSNNWELDPNKPGLTFNCGPTSPTKASLRRGLSYPPEAHMKLFGREVTMWLALVAVLVQTLVAWKIDLSEEQQAGINAVATLLMGLFIALSVARDQIVPAAAGLLVAVLQLAVSFGAHMNQEQIGTAGALLTTILAMWLRTQVTAPIASDGSTVPRVVPMGGQVTPS
jgi:hypothetical protein